MTIEYKLACTNCVTITPTCLDFFLDEDDLENPTKEELMDLCDNFIEHPCDNCGVIGQWLVIKIEQSGSRRYKKQMYMEVSQKGTNISSYVEGDYEQFSNDELKTAFSLISRKAQEMANATGRTRFDSVDPEHGWTTIVVDFLRNKPQPEVSVMFTKNMSYRPVSGLMTYLTQQKTY